MTEENQVAFVVDRVNDGTFSTPAELDRKIEWLLDSGATDHMLRDESLFEELRPLTRKVRIAVAKSGQSQLAETAGTARVKMLVKGE